MDRMIDIHCHILPGVDDGSANVLQSVHMLKIAAEEGISTMVATPHFHLGRKTASYNTIEGAYAELSKIVKQYNVPVDIKLGNEIFYSYEAIIALKQHKAHTMCNSRYVLVEYHPTHSYQDIRKSINELLIEDFIPIVAHVERYNSLLKDLNRVKELIDMGAYIQINSSDLMGDHGIKLKAFCKELLKRRHVHFIATDAHSDKSRAPRLKKAAAYVERKYGEDYANALFIGNALKMMHDEYI